MSYNLKFTVVNYYRIIYKGKISIQNQFFLSD
jgi:hypothetical protein